MKVVSSTLAMLLMAVIVVGLIGMVYFFISGMVGRQTAGVIQIGYSTCIPGTRIEILATNEGTTAIPANQIRVFVRGNFLTIGTHYNVAYENKTSMPTTQNINPGESFWILVSDTDPVTTGTQAPAAGQTYRGQVVYAGKAVDFVVTC